MTDVIAESVGHPVVVIPRKPAAVLDGLIWAIRVGELD
jgi:hypothetical protein